MLVGRATECARIDGLLAGARVGSSGVLVLRGEPGIGKSVLLEYAREHARGMTVLWAHGVESEGDIPFAGLFELLRPALPCLESLPGPQAQALRSALGLGPPVPGDRFLIGAATLSMLTAYAEQQGALLVLVDDAHWLDRSSSDALVFAICRLVADPIAVLLSERPGESPSLDAAGLPDLTVSGLDRSAAAELLRMCDGGIQPAASAEWLYRATAGNPLALIELAREAPALQPDIFDRPLPLTARLERAFARRLADLSESARRAVLLVAACDGGELDPTLAAAPELGLDARALEEAESHGILRIGETSTFFRHPLLRAVAYQAATPADRRAAHAALARVLVAPRDRDRQAWHLARAAIGASASVAQMLEDAAQRARQRSAYAAASSALERAAALSPEDDARSRRLVAAAEAAWLAGVGERTIELLRQALDRAQVPEVRADAEHLLGRALLRRGSGTAGHDVLLDAAKRVQALDPVKATSMLAEAATGLFEPGAADRMLQTARRAWELASSIDDERSTYFASMALGMALIFAGEGADEGARRMRAANAILVGSRALQSDPHVALWAGFGCLWLRDESAGRNLLYAMIDNAREQGALGELPFVLSGIALDCASSDRWPAAQAAFDEIISLARETGQPTKVCLGLAGLCRLEARRGRAEACRDHAAHALELAEKLGLGLYRVWVALALADLAMGASDFEVVIRQGEIVEGLLAELGIHDPDVSALPELAHAYARVGRVEDAHAAADAHLQRAQAKGQPWSLARAVRARGLLADDASFEGYFCEALEWHDRTPDSFERARTQLYLGERLRRARRRSAAREHLRAALAAFTRLGAEPWIDQARAELLATGETARRRDPSTLDQLTPQEFHIAQVLAQGATTREAAAKLFLSPKTIEYHLRSVYSKLGVRSRAELTAILALGQPPIADTRT